ncbi:MAG: mevalonate kinase [Corynebacterium sp.]|uniref:mevalonate kinase n=1 Tax=Corynebacterium sp. TaxID=1720 RepID=UPI003F9AAF44
MTSRDGNDGDHGHHGHGGHVGLGETVAKIILFGEHSVVYGYPAIALPLRNLRMTVRVEPTAGAGVLSGLGWSGPVAEAPERFGGVLQAASAAAVFAGHPGATMDITTHADFPPERGLGSSAAASGAVVRAVLDAYDVTATPEEIFTLTQDAERIAHGQPSGIDTVATAAQSPVLFRAGLATDVPMDLSAWIVVADSGIEGSTRETVAHVRTLHQGAPETTDLALGRLGTITEEAVADLQVGDVEALGTKMTEAHRVLSDLGVSNSQLDGLVSAALGVGAVGAKLTGGGRGGCVIALARTSEDAQRIEDAFAAAGASESWVYVPHAYEVVS